MTDSNHNNPDKALWRRAAPAPEAGPAPDPGLISAWLEGRLSDADAATVERRLVVSPEWLEAAILARAAADGAEGEAVPQSVLARARNLLPGAASTEQARTPVMRWLAARWIEAATASAGVAAAGLLGFMLGQSMIDDYARTEAALTAELPAELDYMLASNWEDVPTLTIPDWEERR